MKDKLKILIGENETDEALDLLLDVTKNEELNKFYNEILLIKANFEELKKQSRLFLANSKELSPEYNRINFSILQIIDEVEKKTNTVKTNNYQNSILRRNAKKNILSTNYIGIALILIVFLVFSFLGKFNPFKDTLELAKHILSNVYGIIGLVICLGAWILYFFRSNRTKTFISILEKANPSEVESLTRSIGYTYDDFSALSQEDKYKFLIRRYLLIAYSFTIIALIVSLFIFTKSKETKIDINGILGMAQDLTTKNMFIEARDQYVKVLNYESTNIEAWCGKINTEIKMRDYENASKSIENAIEKYHKTNQKPIFLAKILKYKGLVNKYSLNIESAIDEFKKGIKIIKDCNEYECIKTLAALNANIAGIYAIEKFDESVKFYLEAIKFDELINDSKGEMIDLTNLSAVYISQKKSLDAKKCLDQAFVIADQTNDIEYKIYLNWRYAALYEPENYKKTQYHYERALELINNDNFDDDRLEGRILGDYGFFLLDKLKNYSLAEKKIMAALIINVKIKDRSGIGYQASSLCDVYVKTKNFDCASIFGLIAVSILRDYDKDEYNNTLLLIDKIPKEFQANDTEIKNIYAKLSDCSGLGKAEWENSLPINELNIGK